VIVLQPTTDSRVIETHSPTLSKVIELHYASGGMVVSTIFCSC